MYILWSASNWWSLALLAASLLPGGQRTVLPTVKKREPPALLAACSRRQLRDDWCQGRPASQGWGAHLPHTQTAVRYHGEDGFETGAGFVRLVRGNFAS